MAKSRQKYVSYPRFISCTLEELMGFEYSQDKSFRFFPSTLSKSNFSRNPSEVAPIEMTAFMFEVINHESLVSPLPFSEKKRKNKSQTMTQPKPKSQGPEASGALPLKRKNSKTQTTSLVQATVTPPKYSKSKPLPEGKSIDAKDPVANKQPTGMGSPSTHTDDGTSKTQPLPKGTNINPKDSGRNTQLADRGQPKALVTNISGTDTKNQADKTQSTRFEVSDPDHNKGKTSSKVDPDTDTLILTTVGDIQALLRDSKDEPKDDIDEEMLEAGEEIG
ncbi:hypothetical protein Tco_0725101 [Tanacetum coccineum]|uniref:Uncharacterized protein n=1 Tax=Tanacetum coccineum TaxID=301880 RepID=A0ABQ4YE47_9ASTR